MKVIIRESRIHDLAIKWLQEKYPDLIEEVSESGISYINPSTNTTVFSIHEGMEGLVMFYGDVFTIFNGMFGLSEQEIGEVIKQWIINNYGLDVRRVALFLK